MNLDAFTIDLSPALGELPARCTPQDMVEIEKRCGPISVVLRRFALVEGSYTESGHVLEVLLTSGDENRAPTREEIDDAIFELGLGETIERLTPFMQRVMSGPKPLPESLADVADENGSRPH